MTIPPDQWHEDYIPTLDDWQAAFANISGAQAAAAALTTANAAAASAASAAAAAATAAGQVGAAVATAHSYTDAQILAGKAYTDAGIAAQFGAFFAGPDANYACYSTSDQAAHKARLVINGSNAGNYSGTDRALIGGQYVVKGSGQPSPNPTVSDYLMQFSIIKEGWPNTTQRGELSGISIVTRNVLDDTGGFIANVGTTTGFGAVLEGVTSQFTNAGAVARAVRVQFGATEGGGTGSAYSAGGILIAQQGTHDVGLQVQSTPDGIFYSYLKFINQLGNVFFSVDPVGNIGIANQANTSSIHFGIDDDGAFGIKDSGQSVELMRVDQAGNVSAHGVYKLGDTQVVGQRIGGFGASSGLRNYAAINFDVAAQSAINQRVAAIEYAMRQHGLIGA